MSIDEREARRRWSSSGMDCAMVDSRIGFINGYVRVPEGHVARHASYDQINRAIRIHGGLTYGTDEAGWVGFDTGHGGDYWPGLSNERLMFDAAEYVWSIERLTDEVENLAAQLAGLTEIPMPETSWDCTEDEFRIVLRQAKAWRRVRAGASA